MTTDQPLRWGMLACGKITNDFCLALTCKSVKYSHQVVACATSNSLERAKGFADKFGISKAYGSYGELLQDSQVQVVYIGSINSAHYGHCKDAIAAGKHVLCEKLLHDNSSETRELFALAKERNVFIMEAVWSRFNPVYNRLQTIIKDQELGQVRSAFANFAAGSCNVPRIKRKDMGGGSLRDIGLYAIQLCLLAFDDQDPDQVVTVGAVDAESGVDTVANLSFIYHGKGTANAFSQTVKNGNRDAYIVFDKGTVKLDNPFWCPTKMEVLDTTGKVIETCQPEYPVPTADGNYNFQNSSWLLFEADHVHECIANGLLESPVWSHGHTLRSVKIIEEAICSISRKMSWEK